MEPYLFLLRALIPTPQANLEWLKMYLSSMYYMC
jgi:hypothetical protein